MAAVAICDSRALPIAGFQQVVDGAAVGEHLALAAAAGGGAAVQPPVEQPAHGLGAAGAVQPGAGLPDELRLELTRLPLGARGPGLLALLAGERIAAGVHSNAVAPRESLDHRGPLGHPF